MKKLLFFVCLSIFLNLLFFKPTQAQSIQPYDSSGYYNFKVANVNFQVDPLFGSRISSLKIDGHEMMFVDRTFGAGYLWGSTLWQSPQNDWGWPPSEALDQNPYQGGIQGDSVSLLSDVDNRYNTGLRFRKTFSANLSDTSVSIRYTMINTDALAHSYSAWELTRVPSGGMAFFPYGEGDITGDFAGQVQQEDSIAWYKYKGTEPESQKFFSDGSKGWYAFINDSKELYIRKFKDVPFDKQAPGESEIELWFQGHSSYIELEVQSEYTRLEAGDSLEWNVDWYVRNLPSSITDTIGDQELIKYVYAVLGETYTIPNSMDDILKGKILLYPNPVSEKLTVELKYSLDNTEVITIFDIQGRISLKQELLKQVSVIDVSTLPTGLYFYQISGINLQSQTGKIIIRR
jgi:hypothetical protein